MKIEREEFDTIYPEFAKTAKEEGFSDIATSFELVAKVEKAHEERYKKLLDAVKNSTVFERPNQIIWECANCGHIHIGKCAPKICPACSHPQSYFELRVENY